MHETDKAACAIATLLDLAPIGVEDAIAEIDARCRGSFNQQQLIETNAEVTMPAEATLLGGRRYRLPDPIDHDEIVA